MATIRRFEDLEVWQLSRKLCSEIFTIISKKEFAEDFKLINQVNGASGSVMDNIAEGFDRGGRKEFIQFLGIARASCGEVKSQLYRALDRKYITEIEFNLIYSLADTITRKIFFLMEYLNKTDIKGNKYKNRVDEPVEPYSLKDFLSK